MELNQPTFIIPSQLGKRAGPLPQNVDPVGQARQTRQDVVLGFHIFRNLAEKKVNMVAVNMSKFNRTNHLCK